ncbi:hypothetical protein LTR53_014343, partial [Teratosphaeriaceae sp. CCFEE 6253]
VMLQTTLVGQLYTVMDKYTRAHQMANPAPGDAEIVRDWEKEFSGFRRELEQSISVVASGKAVQRDMTLPVDKGSTLTGLGLRNKAGGMMGRSSSGSTPSTPSEQQGSSVTGLGIRNKAGGMMGKGGSGHASPSSGEGSSMTGLGIRNKAGGLMNRQGSGHAPASARPMIGGRQESSMSADSGAMTVYHEEDEVAPLKPPRPGGHSPQIAMPSPSVPTTSKPRITSPGAPSAPYPSDSKFAAVPKPPWPNTAAPPSYDQVAHAVSALGTPASRYQTPLSNGAASAAHDYFAHSASKSPSSATTNDNNNNAAHTAMASSLASSALAAAAAKKKAPPPIPTKRILSGQPPPEYVTAIYDYEAQSEGDLAFREGDRILVVHKTESTEDWWEGEVGGQRGSFPANYVRV